MINWSTDEKKFKKTNPKEYDLWRLTQLINYGLDGEKLDRDFLKSSWSYIKGRIDVETKAYFQYLLWGIKPSSIRHSKNSLNLS